MTYSFEGTPQDVMSSFSHAAEAARKGDVYAEGEWLHLMRCLVGLYDRQAVAGRIDPEVLRRFRRESAEILASFEWDLNSYVRLATYLAEGANEDEWYELCWRRSAIQSLLEDYAGTRVLDFIYRGEVVDLDLELCRVGAEQGPVPDKYVPKGLPESHWWWSYPRAEDGAATFDRPLYWLAEALHAASSATTATTTGEMPLDQFADVLSEGRARLEGVRAQLVLRADEQGIDAFVKAELGQVERLQDLLRTGHADASAVRRLEEAFAEHEPAGRGTIWTGLSGSRQVRHAADVLRLWPDDVRAKAKMKEAIVMLQIATTSLQDDYHGPLGARFAAYLERHQRLAEQLAR